MNPFPSSLDPEQVSSTSPSMPLGTGSDIIVLSCPVCQKDLNLLRKHFGVAGNCVHCQAPVKVIEDQLGGIVVENLSLDQAEEQSDFSVSERPEGKMTMAPPSEVPALAAHQSPPPFLSEPEESINAMPPAFPEEALFSGKPQQEGTPQSFSQGNSESDGGKIEAFSAQPFGGETEKTSLFEDESISPSGDSEIPTGAKTPWSEPSPSETGGTGFAETLFSGTPEASGVGTAEASANQSSKSAIGYPMEQASMKKLKSSGTPKAIFPLVKSLRNLVVIAVVGLMGYVGFSMVPPDKTAAAKEQIKEWLKPGAVLLEDLPFKIPGLSDEEPAHSKPVVIERKQAPLEAEPAPVKPEPVEPVTEKLPQ